MPSKRKFILEKYAKYDRTTDTSVCIIPTCKKALQGKRAANIKRHYKLSHHVNIESSDESDDNDNEPMSSSVLKIADSATIPKDTTSASAAAFSTRGKKSFVLERYVSFDRTTNKSTCLVENCGKTMRGCRPITIKHHYVLQHNCNIGTGSDDETYSSDESSGLWLPKRRKGNSDENILVDKDSFLKCCLGLLTVKNLPFSIFDDDEFFKKLISPYEKNFRTNLNSEKMHNLLDINCHQIRQIIKKRIKNKMISLKIDFASFMEKYVIGVNIQYIHENRIYNNTIGMFQVIEQRTERQMREDILNCLEDFGIKLKQIYSFTINNGASMDKVLRGLEDVQERIGGAFDESLSEFVQLKILATFKGSHFCAAHKIDVAAHEVIISLNEELNQCCDVVESLDLTRVTEANPDIVLPCHILLRWDSTYKIIRTISLLKNHVGNANIDWAFVENFLYAFKPLMELSKKCQEEQYVFGDFYRDWLTCELELEELREHNPYADALHTVMNRGKQEMLRENHSLLAALYLDPRFNFENTPMLTETQKEIGLKRLLKTALKIIDVESDGVLATATTPDNQADRNGNEAGSAAATVRTTTVESPTSSHNNSIGSNNESASGSGGIVGRGTGNNSIGSAVQQSSANNTSNTYPYEKLTQRIHQMITNSNKIPAEPKKYSLCQKLQAFGCGQMAPMSTNVLEFWQKHYGDDIEITKLVQVVLAIPSQQISVAHAYDALTSILINPTQKPTNKMLTKLYITKLNYNLI